ncbi:Pectinesterase inhibitor [Cynara cardunculus var. scolymus]|uniref:Pectinesterase inhibitor n=2 Tax=Cynara cardunculus var. scolymus TaxID=59895 RepID=A0A103XVK9_CYNCS|nr:Pectinesterase inhibitor [Cynara cardunculus var. scolymus]
MSTTILALITAAAVAVANPSPPTSGDTDFIRTSCRTTLYPQLCYTSLSSYSNAVQQDPGRLARVAIGVTLSKATHMAKYVSNISRNADYDGSPRVAAAVHDCFSVFGDAVDEIRGSLRQMRRLGGSGESLRFQLSNVQTWMSAALTNEETCTDGFEDVADDGGVKAEVCDRAVKVKEVTSNALALVNSFANAIQTP